MTGFGDDLKRHLTDGESPATAYDDVLARVRRRRTRRRAATMAGSALAVGALVATGIALSRPHDRDTVVDPGPVASTSSSPTSTASAPAGADPVAAVQAALPEELDGFEWGDDIFHFLAGDGSIVDESPWTACMSDPPDDDGISHGGCWDGSPKLSGIGEVGSPEALWFSFDFPGWDFEHVTFRADGDGDCGRTMSVEAVKVTDRVFRIDPVGPAGTYRVDVFGRGEDGGDAVTSVRWTTKTSSAGPEPRATGSLFTDEGGQRVAPYGGPYLSLAELAETPAEASASWTVTDSAGRSVTVPLHRETHKCQGAGNVYFTGRELTAAELATLKGDQVTYTVRVTLDGVEHVGTAVWPDDESDEPPYVDLTFDPPLPRYAG